MNLGCSSETCCTWLAENAGPKKVAKNRLLGTIAQLCWAISWQLRQLSTIGKNLLSSNMSSTCPHNMMNFSPLAAEIDPVVWGTPANFNGFRLTSFFSIVDTCVSCEDIAQQSCAMVPRWRFLATFLRPVFSASRVQQVSDLHLKFALRPHHVWKYGRHPICSGWD